MRHCERDPYNISFESPLLEVGQYNVKKLFNTMDVYNITKLYSSPFLRTIQTASYYSNKKNIPIHIDYSLCEFVVEEEKNLMTSLHNFIIPNTWHNTYNIIQKNMLIDTFNNTETLDNCLNRVETFINHIIEAYKNTDENILLITHMSIVNVILKVLKKNDETFFIDKYYPMGLITKVF